ETEFGRKRVIDQSSCNKDFSCLNGFCPSFVTVHGGTLKKAAPVSGDGLPDIPEPEIAPLTATHELLVTGVGGTGVVTVGAVLGMAAHLHGYGVGIIDMAGLAQKGGAVTTHMKIAPKPDDIHAIRVAAERADTVLACDIVVAGSQKALAAIRPGASQVFVNTHEFYPGDFTRDADFTLPSRQLAEAIGKRAGKGRAHFIEAQRLASALMGDAIATNMFMVGYAWQHGGLPVSRDAIHEAIRLNGVAPQMNIAAFEWGRRAAHDPASVELAAGTRQTPDLPGDDLETLVSRRADYLTAYQDAAYAARYRAKVEMIAEAERKTMPGQTGLAQAVARSLFKLMAIKDEFEVARLYTDGSFERQLAETFQNWDRLEFHLAPPLIARRDGKGHLTKQRFGPWMMRAFKLLAAMKGLRGSWLDPFSRTAERRWERQLLADYEQLLGTISGHLSPDNHTIGVALAAYPQKIRGFGHIKEAQADAALAERDRLLAAFLSSEPARLAEAAE
ncbi:MAG TPA: DUF6537 domain-containing protein, partial [Afifellaceae bacterium]|nr:DUF6537 domain-containing protein [Afifellaceae bacterium]